MADEIVLTRQQVRTVDSRAINELGIPGVVLMENAGRTAAEHVIAALRESGGSRVLILGGPGNNGGDGWVIARHLHIAGYAVTCCLCGSEDRLSGDAKINYRIARKMPVEHMIVQSLRDVGLLQERLAEADLIVDGLLGTGFAAGTVRSPLDAVIDAVNACESATVVALDVPSGLDCDTGQPSRPTMRADLTVTFVARKVGFLEPAAKDCLGRVVVAGIGTPPELTEEVAAQALSKK